MVPPVPGCDGGEWEGGREGGDGDVLGLLRVGGGLEDGAPCNWEGAGPGTVRRCCWRARQGAGVQSRSFGPPGAQPLLLRPGFKPGMEEAEAEEAEAETRGRAMGGGGSWRGGEGGPGVAGSQSVFAGNELGWRISLSVSLGRGLPAASPV